MAINIIASPKRNTAGPALDILDPVAIAEKKARHDDRHDPLGQPTRWSIPQTTNASPKAFDDHSVSLEIGVVTEIQPGGPTWLQIGSDNEDDRVEFSTHGDPDGIWMKLNTGTILEIHNPVFLLNRTHYENIPVAILEEH